MAQFCPIWSHWLRAIIDNIGFSGNKLLRSLDDGSGAEFTIRVEALVDLRLVEEGFADLRLQDGQLRLKKAASLRVLGQALGGAPAPLIAVH